jgi:hypothetical protein
LQQCTTRHEPARIREFPIENCAKKEATSLFVMLSLRFSALLRCMAYVHSAASALGARLTWPVSEKKKKKKT